MVHASAERRAELADGRPAEARAHGVRADERLVRGVGEVVAGQPLAAGEAERGDELLDAVEVADDEVLPELEGAGEVTTRAVLVEEAEELLVGEVSGWGVDGGGSARGWGL